MIHTIGLVLTAAGTGYLCIAAARFTSHWYQLIRSSKCQDKQQ